MDVEAELNELVSETSLVPTKPVHETVATRILFAERLSTKDAVAQLRRNIDGMRSQCQEYKELLAQSRVREAEARCAAKTADENRAHLQERVKEYEALWGTSSSRHENLLNEVESAKIMREQNGQLTRELERREDEVFAYAKLIDVLREAMNKRLDKTDGLTQAFALVLSNLEDSENDGAYWKNKYESLRIQHDAQTKAMNDQLSDARNANAEQAEIIQRDGAHSRAMLDAVASKCDVLRDLNITLSYVRSALRLGAKTDRGRACVRACEAWAAFACRRFKPCWGN